MMETHTHTKMKSNKKNELMKILYVTPAGVHKGGATKKNVTSFIQDCYLQKEARVCVSDNIVVEDSKFKCFFFYGRWASDRGSRCANIVVEWKGILAEGTVVWNDYENNIVKIIKGLLTALSHQYALFYQC